MAFNQSTTTPIQPTPIQSNEPTKTDRTFESIIISEKDKIGYYCDYDYIYRTNNNLIKEEIFQENLKNIADLYLSGVNTEYRRLRMLIRINTPLAIILADFLKLNTLITLDLSSVYFLEPEAEKIIMDAIINSESIRTLDIMMRFSFKNDIEFENYLLAWANVIYKNKSITCLQSNSLAVGNRVVDRKIIDKVNDIHISKLQTIFNDTHLSLDKVCPTPTYLSDEDFFDIKCPKINDDNIPQISPYMFQIMCSTLPIYGSYKDEINTRNQYCPYAGPSESFDTSDCEITNPRILDNFTTRPAGKEFCDTKFIRL